MNPSRKPSDFPLLLEVFRDGLSTGIISKEQVVSWADQIIIEDEEPNYFFIELSLCGGTNDLIEAINEYHTENQNVICTRVLFSIAYTKLVAGKNELSAESVALSLEHLVYTDNLSQYERNMMWGFIEHEFYYEVDEMQVDLINFLFVYKEFNLTNIQHWPEINKHVETVLTTEQEKLDAVNAAHSLAWQKSERKRKIKRNFMRVGVILVAIAILYAVAALCKNDASATTTIVMILMLWTMRRFWGDKN